MADNFYTKQNLYLKLIFIIINIIICLIARFPVLAIYFALNTIFFSFSAHIIISFLKVCLKLSFFWIFYLLCALLINIPFEQQISFLLSVLFILQISVFFRQSLSQSYFLYDTYYLRRYTFFTDLCYFFLYTDFLIKYLFVHIENIDLHSTPPSTNRLDHIIHQIKNILQNALSMKNNMPKIDFHSLQTLHRPFITATNVIIVTICTLWLTLYLFIF